LKVLGVLGEKLPHSYSPYINKRIMELTNVEGAYTKFELPLGHMEEFIKGIKILNIGGFNITIPYKEEVMPYLDHISKEAKSIGAVNTVANIDGKLYGYNTDYFGFSHTLKVNNITIKDKVIVILGNGGACKAIKDVAIDEEAKSVYIVSRNPKDITQEILSDKVKIISYDQLLEIEGDILVNSTPVGMSPKVGISPVGPEIIKDYDVVVDIVYNPKETEFLRLGKELGKITVGGLYMLIGQAVKSEEIFHDVTIDEEVINIIYDEMKESF
jgi:shikimate dehydrogenase